MGLKWENLYRDSKEGSSRADSGNGSRFRSSVWGGCLSGRMRDLNETGMVVSAFSHWSDTALHRCAKI